MIHSHDRITHDMYFRGTPHIRGEVSSAAADGPASDVPLILKLGGESLFWLARCPIEGSIVWYVGESGT